VTPPPAPSKLWPSDPVDLDNPMANPSTHLQPDPLLTENETRIFLQCSGSWLAKARMSGDGPNFIKIGRLVRYSMKDVQEYINRNRSDFSRRS
jgi:hypothetical protein